MKFMKNKTVKKVVCLAAACCIAGGAIACGNPFIEEEEEADTTKMQLYVGNFNQGFGKAWLVNAAERFSELKKDAHYSDDTTGVQIWVDDVNVGDNLLGSIKNERSEMIFNESMSYYSWVQRGYLRDITDVVTGDLAAFGESGKTIESKMYPSAKEFYRYTDNKIYGIPFYESTFGIIYDIDVFSDNNLFMDKNGNFTLSSQDSPNASAGPDGDLSTVVDNGLPATFSEFYKLCDKMIESNIQPFTWTGRNANYISRFIQSMSMYLDGYAESMIHFNLSGKATNIIDHFDGETPVYMPETTITSGNANLMYGSAGKYYALDFLQHIIEGKYYYETKLNSGAYNHRDAQDDFVTNNTPLASNSLKKDMAMLIDGTWFMNEALGTFNDLAKKDVSAGINERRFGLMPLPHPDGWESKKYTYVDTNQTLCCITTKLPDSKMQLASDFMQFLHTDAELTHFTEDTSTIRAYNYLDGLDMSNSKLTPYVKQLIDLKKFIGNEVIYPISKNATYANNTNRLFFDHSEFMACKVGNYTVNSPISEMSGNNAMTAKQYFEGMKSAHDSAWWSKINVG